MVSKKEPPIWAATLTEHQRQISDIACMKIRANFYDFKKILIPQPRQYSKLRRPYIR